jgi:8-hydroxy-5-deazaflavin:NADPH oxidoreductase
VKGSDAWEIFCFATGGNARLNVAWPGGAGTKAWIMMHKHGVRKRYLGSFGLVLASNGALRISAAIMKIGIIGSGEVAQTLGGGFLKHSHEVMMGTREPAKLEAWSKKNPKGRVGSFADAAKFAELVVLAVKGTVAAEALRGAGAANLAGKPVIDATNPIAEAAPENGVLKFVTDLDDSLMEQLQRTFPAVRFVKAFNSVGAGRMVNPQFTGGKPTMFICGNDDAAKKSVTMILDQFGWETADMGKAPAARAIEPLCMLWCIPGFLRNEWSHAFKLLK